VDADAVGREFGISRADLLNDLQAIAVALPHLESGDLEVLNEGEREERSCRGVVAPGTGLGEAYLTWSDGGYRAWRSEGGHASFAPTTVETIELLEHLLKRLGHVSFDSRATLHGAAWHALDRASE
jgi:glucokinase